MQCKGIHYLDSYTSGAHAYIQSESCRIADSLSSSIDDFLLSDDGIVDCFTSIFVSVVIGTVVIFVIPAQYQINHSLDIEIAPGLLHAVKHSHFGR